MKSFRTPPAPANRVRPLGVDFFDRPAERVARDLLGAWLVVRGLDGRTTRHVVFETEAYLGAHDLACHGSKGMTKRNATMFGRGVGEHVGPGRVTKALGIDRSLDGRPATRRGGLWFEASGIRVPPRLVERTPRIGVGYAGEWAEKPLRFVVDPGRLPTISKSGRPKP